MVFGLLFLILNGLVMDGVGDALNIGTYGSLSKMIMLNEALPTTIATLLLFLPMGSYNRWKDKPYATTGFILYLIIVFLFFMIITHPRYVIDYQIYEVWIYHNLVCLTIIIWNISNILMKRYEVH